MELRELASTYPCIRMDLTDNTSVGAGRRIVFIVSQDKHHIGLYSTMGVFHMVKKECVLGAEAYKSEHAVRWTGDELQVKREGAWCPIGDVVDKVFNPETGSGGDSRPAFSEPIWAGGDML